VLEIFTTAGVTVFEISMNESSGPLGGKEGRAERIWSSLSACPKGSQSKCVETTTPITIPIRIRRPDKITRFLP
jgi:hypothetical protein